MHRLSLAASRNLQCLSDLVTAITRLSRENSEEQSEVSQNESVTDTIRDLFPSVNGQTSQSTSSSSRAQTPDNSQPSNLTQEDVVERPKTNNQTPDRRFVQQFENFVTNNSGKKRTKFIKKPTGSKKPKRGDQRTVFKDVILLPDPKQQKVPRGTTREALYSHGFTTTIELHPSMTENDIRKLLEERFSRKLWDLNKSPKFEFVRAVHNKLVSIDQGQTSDARLLKHISGQGPIYIRANGTIAYVINACVVVKDESSSENSTDDEQTLIRTSMIPQTSTAGSANIATIVDQHCASKPVLTVESATNADVQISQSVTGISCPTCNERFPHNQIAEHADRCAESAWTGTEQQYVSLMSEVDRVDYDEQESSESALNLAKESNAREDCNNGNDIDVKSELNREIQSLQTNMGTAVNRINVQRKSVLDDYVAKPTKCSWFHPQNKLKVVFIGEPAVDDGGPRREFFSGTAILWYRMTYMVTCQDIRLISPTKKSLK